MKLSKDNELLRKMQLQIKQDGEEEGNKPMKQVYKEQRKALDDMVKFIAFLYVTHSVNGLLSVKKSEKRKIVDDSEKMLVGLGKNLGKQEIMVVNSVLTEGFKNAYYTNAFIYQLGGLNVNFKIHRQEFIDAIVNKKFKSEDFSSRIWTNKSTMIDTLQSEILNNLRGQTPIDVAVKNIQKKFNTTAYQSERLFTTELARIQSEAHDNIARQAGIKRQLFDATLDSHTSNLCISYDGTEWDIDDPVKPIPPLHPLCRSALIDLTDSWSYTTKRDNATKELISYKKYNEWLDDKGIAD